MLIAISERITGWMTWVIISLLVMAFGLWGIQYYLHRGANKKPVAVVNGSKITQKTFDATYQRLRREQQMQLGKKFVMNDLLEKQLKQQTLKQLVLAELTSQALEKAKFAVSPTQLDYTITQMPLFQENGEFSQARFSNVLNALYYTENGFFAEVRHSLLAHQLENGFEVSAFSLPSEVTQAYQAINQTRQFRTAMIDNTRFFGDIHLTDKTLKAYYQEHLTDFHQPEKVRLDYLKLTVSALSKRIKVSDKEAKAFYEQNNSRYNLPFAKVKSSVKKAVAEQKAQQQFADVADQLANLTYANPDSLEAAATQLHLTEQQTGWLTKQGGKTTLLKNSAVLHAAFGADVLAQGNNSDVINVDPETVVVIRVAQHTAAAPKPFAQVKPEIKHALQGQRALAKAGALAAHVMAALRHGQSAAAVAKQYQLTWRDQQQTSHGDKNTSLLTQAVFALPLPGKQADPAAVTLANGVVVVMLDKVTPASLKPSESGYNAFRDEVAHADGELASKLYLQGLIAQAKLSPATVRDSLG